LECHIFLKTDFIYFFFTGGKKPDPPDELTEKVLAAVNDEIEIG